MIIASKAFRITALGRHIRFSARQLAKPRTATPRSFVGLLNRRLDSRTLSTTTANKSIIESTISDGSPSTLIEYLNYAMYRNLNINSTVFIGSLYELQVKEYLEMKWPLPVSRVKIVGGAGDRGLDIDAMMGKFRLLVQCKCYSSQRVDPKLLREIKGAIQDVPAKSAKVKTPLVAMIASTNGFTRQGRTDFDKATIPMIFLKFSRPKLVDITKPYEMESWKLGEMIGWEANWMAQSMGLGVEEKVNKKRTKKKIEIVKDKKE